MKSRSGFDRNHLITRDVLVIVPLFLVIFAAFILGRGMLGEEGYIRWVGLAANTTVLFGLLIWQSRTEGLGRSFWTLWAICLLSHLTFFILLTHFIEFNLGWYMLMYLEIPVLHWLRSGFVRG